MRIQHPEAQGMLECDCGSTSFCSPFEARYIMPDTLWINTRCTKCTKEIRLIKVKNLDYPATKEKEDGISISVMIGLL